MLCTAFFDRIIYDCGMIDMKKIGVVAPTSVVASNYIAHIEGKFQYVTIGRRCSDIIFDIANDDNLLIQYDIDSVIYFAGVLFAKTGTDVCDMIDVNISGVIKVCEAVKKTKGCHLIFVSSINATLNDDSQYYSYYSLTKKCGEEIVKLFCKKQY